MISMHFVAPQGEWSPDRQAVIGRELVAPLVSDFSNIDAQLSLNLSENAQGLTLWGVLQTFDRASNTVFRCQNPDFFQLVREAERVLASRLASRRRSKWKGRLEWLTRWRARSPHSVFRFS